MNHAEATLVPPEADYRERFILSRKTIEMRPDPETSEAQRTYMKKTSGKVIFKINKEPGIMSRLFCLIITA